MQCEWGKGKGIVDGCPFPSLNTNVHISTQCLCFNESHHLGARFCFRRQLLVLFGTDLGRWDHDEQASDKCGDNKRPPALSSLLFQSKTIEGERDWFNHSHHLEYSTRCHSISDETLSVAQSRRVTSNYRGRSPLNWGLFHPINFYCKG